MITTQHFTKVVCQVSNTSRAKLQRSRTCLGLIAVIASAFPGVAGAQVGHAPDASPYREVRARHVASAFGGYLQGEAGKVGVGPTDGLLIGARYEFLFSGPVAIDLRIAFADLDRGVIDPTQLPGQRDKGTFSQSVVMADAGINLVLTGAKTWRGLAPYVGGALGLAFGGKVPQDSSTFEFQTQFMVAPQAGVRWHIGDRVVVRFEGRDAIWRLKYPDLFFDPPVADPDGEPVLDPLTNSNTDWTHHLVLTISLGYALRL